MLYCKYTKYINKFQSIISFIWVGKEESQITKCVCCKREIKLWKNKHENFGCDGDFIHKECRPKMNKKIDNLANMSDSQFYNWMGVERS